ncbi:hypothetical protein BaRGS_00015373 [Batillaria attramentaria]|uniref:Uncharacterized protein n=1 Tax=Batillaria attramentaria TaxID=370345 RepID=A0ABD0L2L5_9CAEN
MITRYCLPPDGSSFDMDEYCFRRNPKHQRLPGRFQTCFQTDKKVRTVGHQKEKQNWRQWSQTTKRERNGLPLASGSQSRSRTCLTIVWAANSRGRTRPSFEKELQNKGGQTLCGRCFA